MTKMTLKKLLPVLMFLLVFVSGYLVTNYLQSPVHSGHHSSVTVPESCGFDSTPCRIMLADSAVAIEVKGAVSPLQPFQIELLGQALSQVQVSFTMIGMDMGVNRFYFSHDTGDSWQAQVMLPVCSASRKDWLAEFLLKFESGEQFLVQYPFNTL
jgi:hypothetical protein